MNNTQTPTQIVTGILAYLKSIDQIAALPEVVKLLGQQMTQDKDLVRVESAISLSESEKTMIESWVVDNIGRNTIEYSLNPSIIGGFRLCIGDQCIDLSVAHKRNQIYAK